MAYSNIENQLIKEAKELFLKNPNDDFDFLAEKFIKKHSSKSELMLCDCLTEAHEQINQ